MTANAKSVEGLPGPAGTFTFLFSDIEGSTVRWERDRHAMAPALERHDDVVRAALEARGGYIFKTVGDAFCATFGAASDAVAAAVDAQRALAAEDFAAVDGIRVRIAIHAGESIERGGDYFGPTINRVARLLAIAHGGQVLISGACMELLDGETPPQCDLRDLGEHRLKDLTRPERVFQLVAPDLTVDFPPLRSLGTYANNLPLQLTSFVGRETEIAEITALFDSHRLVTLTGSGGVGKTRASLQAAANLLDGFGDGVWFIELAPLTRGDYVVSTVAQVLGVNLATQGDPLQTLVDALREKRALLVFDNCEHVVDGAAFVVSALVRGCPKISVLASSRQALQIAGEATYRMPSLPLDSAISLFVERARSAEQRFQLTDENAPIVADICRRLDGIPLAIELASARVRMLAPKQLRERLDERFRVLTGGSRDALPRQQTLRAMIDWSYDLLDDRERALFRRLGSFGNGFTIEAATAIGAGDDLDELGVFDVMASLVDKSLVLAEPQGESTRYRLLESTRAYALEKLDTGERDRVGRRHLEYLRDHFVELRRHAEQSGRQTLVLQELHAYLDDIRSALDGAFQRAEVRTGAELLAPILTLWRNLGLEAEGIARGRAYIAATPESETRSLASLLTGLAFLLDESGQKAGAFDAAVQAVTYARMSADPATLAWALARFANEAIANGRLDEAEAALAEIEKGPHISRRFRLLMLERQAFLSQNRGDFEAAVRICEQLRKEHLELGNARHAQTAALNLAEAEHARGQTARAIAILREILPAARAGSNEHDLAYGLYNLAAYLVAVDDLPGATAAAREVIEMLADREPGHVFIAASLEHLALALALGGEIERAATLEGYSDAAFTKLGFLRDFTEKITYERLKRLLQMQLAPNDLSRLIAQGAALAPQAAIALALEVK